MKQKWFEMNDDDLFNLSLATRLTREGNIVTIEFRGCRSIHTCETEEAAIQDFKNIREFIEKDE